MKGTKNVLSDDYKTEVDELVRRKQWKRLLTATFVLDILRRESSYGNKIEKKYIPVQIMYTVLILMNCIPCSDIWKAKDM